MVRHSAEQWSAWVEQHRESGLSVFDFCDEVGVSTNSFYRWRSKLAENEVGPIDRAVPSSAFVPLSVVGSVGIEIDLPCGSVVRVPTNDRAIRGVLQALMDVRSEKFTQGGDRC